MDNAILEKYAAYLHRLSHIRHCRMPMAELTSFRIGGPADVLFPAREEELCEALCLAHDMGVQPFILGNGTNLLVRDGGMEQPVLCIGRELAAIEQRENEFKAQTGALLNVLAKQTVRCGFAGLEWACGIPGSVGGAVAMNAGAYGGEIKQTLMRVRYIENGRLCTAEVRPEDMGYRSSVYSAPERVVLSAVFALQNDDGHTRERMEDYTQRRTTKQPLNLPSAGSIFKRPEGHFAGALIEAAGLKGAREGGAQVSELHAGFIVNTGGATAMDVCRLIERIKKRVYKNSGVMLDTEVRVIGIGTDEE